MSYIKFLVFLKGEKNRIYVQHYAIYLTFWCSIIQNFNLENTKNAVITNNRTMLIINKQNEYFLEKYIISIKLSMLVKLPLKELSHTGFSWELPGKLWYRTY